jgi:hypothetical protein
MVEHGNGLLLSNRGRRSGSTCLSALGPWWRAVVRSMASVGPTTPRTTGIELCATWPGVPISQSNALHKVRKRVSHSRSKMSPLMQRKTGATARLL